MFTQQIYTPPALFKSIFLLNVGCVCVFVCVCISAHCGKFEDINAQTDSTATVSIRHKEQIYCSSDSGNSFGKSPNIMTRANS